MYHLTARLLAQYMLLVGTELMIKRAWMGRARVTRQKDLPENFDRVDESGQEQYSEDHDLRPHGKLAEKQANSLQLGPTPLHKRVQTADRWSGQVGEKDS